MKKLKLISIAWVLLLVLPCAAMATPVVEVKEPVFIFEQVPDGAHVSHDFIIKNNGDTDLNILAADKP